MDDKQLPMLDPTRDKDELAKTRQIMDEGDPLDWASNLQHDVDTIIVGADVLHDVTGILSKPEHEPATAALIENLRSKALKLVQDGIDMIDALDRNNWSWRH